MCVLRALTRLISGLVVASHATVVVALTTRDHGIVSATGVAPPRRRVGRGRLECYRRRRLSRRQKPHLRCADCRMHRGLCICALLPRISTRTRVVLVLHQLEALKPTNTGILAAKC